jgi:protein tyrosine/serine phosphatase
MPRFSAISFLILSMNVLASVASASTPEGGDKPHGTTLVRVAEVAPGIYRGSRPNRDADFEYLRGLGIRTILSLQDTEEGEQVGLERAQAERLGFAFFNSGVRGLPTQPTVASVDRAEQILADPSLRPIYLHCKLGRDRTGMVAAL